MKNFIEDIAGKLLEQRFRKIDDKTKIILIKNGVILEEEYTTNNVKNLRKLLTEKGLMLNVEHTSKENNDEEIKIILSRVIDKDEFIIKAPEFNI